MLSKLHPFDYQASSVDISFLASRPNTVILMFNRRVQEKVVFISKKPSRISLADKNYPMKIVKFMVNVLYGSVVVQLRCGGFIVHCSIRSSVRIKQFQEFLKLGSWLRRNCIMSAGVFYFKPPCVCNMKLYCRMNRRSLETFYYDD